MSHVNTLLEQRLKKSSHSSKMAEMALQSASGNLTSFSGVFNVTELNAKEKELLRMLLKEFSTGKADIASDLPALISITSEVKAINNQAAILHGERIKKAQKILINYKEGAFTCWLLATYGNRQTPYNFLQYYEFYEHFPKTLQSKLDEMPRQAVYTLASRQGPMELKQKIVENYQGETKTELLVKIRELFPLSTDDKRAQDPAENLILALTKIVKTAQRSTPTLTKNQKQSITYLLNELKKIIL